MPTDDLNSAKDLGWKVTATGEISFLPVHEYATLPVVGGIVVAGLRVATQKSGQTSIQQLQLGFSLQQSKEFAEKLLAAVASAELEATPTDGKPN